MQKILKKRVTFVGCVVLAIVCTIRPQIVGATQWELPSASEWVETGGLVTRADSNQVVDTLEPGCQYELHFLVAKLNADPEEVFEDATIQFDPSYCDTAGMYYAFPKDRHGLWPELSFYYEHIYDNEYVWLPVAEGDEALGIIWDKTRIRITQFAGEESWEIEFPPNEGIFYGQSVKIGSSMHSEELRGGIQNGVVVSFAFKTTNNTIASPVPYVTCDGSIRLYDYAIEDYSDRFSDVDFSKIGQDTQDATRSTGGSAYELEVTDSSEDEYRKDFEDCQHSNNTEIWLVCISVGSVITSIGVIILVITLLKMRQT